MKPVFSIIIPVYNVAPYLRECLDSVLAQTFTDWEAICVDDGSTDNSAMILDEFGARDGRIRIIHQENQGVEFARNIGLAHAEGDRIIFMDGDDSIESKYLAEHYVALANEPMDTITYSPHIDIYADGRTCDYDKKYKDFKEKRELCISLLQDGWSPIIHGWVWPRSVLSRGGGWRTDIIANDDLEFAFRHIAIGRGFRYVRNVKAIYHRHNCGLSHMAHDEFFYFSVLEAAVSRERFALYVEDSTIMRNAIAQMWYSLLFSPSLVVDAFSRRYIRLRVARLGVMKCCCFAPTSKKGRIVRWFGVTGLLYASLAYYKMVGFCKLFNSHNGN